MCTTVMMHHLDSVGTHEKKARWEQHKNVMCWSEQILEASAQVKEYADCISY